MLTTSPVFSLHYVSEGHNVEVTFHSDSTVRGRGTVLYCTVLYCTVLYCTHPSPPRDMRIMTRFCLFSMQARCSGVVPSPSWAFGSAPCSANHR